MINRKESFDKNKEKKDKPWLSRLMHIPFITGSPPGQVQ